MKHILNGSLMGVLLFFIAVMPVKALPIISVDMDPGTAGIQSKLTVNSGDIFSVDIVYTGDNIALFDTTIFDVGFNNVGSALSLNSGPIAGQLAGMAFHVAFDPFSSTGSGEVVPGDALTTGFFPTPAGFSNGIGGVGIFSPFPFTELGYFPGTPIGAGVNVDILSLSFIAENLGTSILDVVEFPSLSPLLAFGGSPVELEDIRSGFVTVAPVPEPATLLLLASGLAGLGAFGRKKFRSPKA